MKIEDAKFYCIVEFQTSDSLSRQAIFSGEDLETYEGITKTCNHCKVENNAKSAMIIFIQKLK